ncbi:MAG: hypothetical protein QOE25_1157 [Actinomycetota bacterium]|nr:hypothetical protein [Actinomycetota bacterium]
MTTRSLATRMLASPLILLFACASRSSTPRATVPRATVTSATTAPTTSPSAEPPLASSQWLIVLRAADDPGGVRDDAETLGPALGDAIQVAPGSCFTGIPSRFGGDRYIVGALGSSKAEVDALAADAGIEPLFEGQVHVVCVD